MRWPIFDQPLDWRRGLVLVLLVALVATFVQLARALWVFVEPEPQNAAAIEPVALDMAVLNLVDPFFAEGQAAVEATNDNGGFNLFGVSADGSGGGSAIIGLPDGTQVSVAAGEEVTSGAVLKTVNPDHVIVAMNGRFLRVGFPEMPVEQTQASQEETPAADAEQAPAQAALVDPTKLVAEAGLRPKLEGLSIKGLQVSASENATQLTAAGLQDGDIILSVNGTALTSPQAMSTLRQRLSNAATAEISYERGGQRRMTSIRTR
ncbi:MAG: type II secretion system protein N [Brevundimonas sp.]